MQLLSFVIIEKNNRYLLVCETSEKWKGKWFFPGGKMEVNEDPVSAAIRETKEEAVCDVVLDGIFYFKLEKRLFSDKLHVYYYGHTDDAIVKTDEDEHSFGSKWFTYEEMIKLPLREDALMILDIYRAADKKLPIHNFNFIRHKGPYQILKKDFNPF